MKKKIGFIGCGNMGEAILAGALHANVMDASDVYVSTANPTNAKRLSDVYEVHACRNNRDVYKTCDYVFLAVKPYQFAEVLKELQEIFDESKTIISIAAGMTIDHIRELFKAPSCRIIRVMPNTPSLVNAGASGICQSDDVEACAIKDISSIFAAIGIVEEVDEERIHAIVATSGSSPAYVFMFIDAIIQEAMKEGLDYEVARRLAAQTTLGAAKMVLTSEDDVTTLKENVCSPNGTTIEAVHVLEDEKFSDIIAKAMQACYKKSKKMSE